MEVKRRSSIQIIGEILSLCQKPAKRTRIVYGTNINFQLLQNYLDLLMGQGLIQENADGTFVTTEKGSGALNQIQNIQLVIFNTA